MDFRAVRAAVSRGSMTALLIAVIVLWSTIAIAGVNEDLIKAAERGDLPEVKRLLAEGADVNAKGKFGLTPLMVASRKGQPEVVRMLLAKGANVNAKNNMGMTALMIASMGGHREIKEMLIKAGAK